MLLRRMKLADITVHGFRSTFRDWCGDATSFPREVAEAAVWMTGPDAGFLAGTNVYLDGGVLSRLHDPA